MAIKTVTLAATRRDETGKGVARKLRAAGRLPAVIYGRGSEPRALSLATADYERAMAGHSSTSIIDLDVDGATTKALIRDVQRHPVRPGPMHIDFYEIHEGVMLTMDVPIHLVGVPIGVKRDGGVLDQILREVEIEVLPRDIPDRIDVDVSHLEITDSIHLRDVQVPNVKFLADPDATICTVAAPRVEEAPAVEEEGLAIPGGEPEVIGRDKTDADDAGDS